MPAIIFTAEPTDLITSVGHGLNTGDGAGSVLNIGGSLPGGLSATTDYYWIRVDADHGKLATSVANALAGVPVDITSTGSGQHWFGIGLPFRRQRTFAVGSILPPDDLNAIQDCTAGQRFRPTPVVIPGAAFVPNGNSSGLSRTGSVWTIAGTTNQELICDLYGDWLVPGTRITSLSWSMSITGSDNYSIQWRLKKRSFGNNGASAADAISDQLTRPPTGVLLRETVQTPYLVEDNMMYQLSLLYLAPTVTGTVTVRFDGARIVADRL